MTEKMISFVKSVVSGSLRMWLEVFREIRSEIYLQIQSICILNKLNFRAGRRTCWVWFRVITGAKTGTLSPRLRPVDGSEITDCSKVFLFRFRRLVFKRQVVDAFRKLINFRDALGRHLILRKFLVVSEELSLLLQKRRDDRILGVLQILT